MSVGMFVQAPQREHRHCRGEGDPSIPLVGWLGPPERDEAPLRFLGQLGKESLLSKRDNLLWRTDCWFFERGTNGWTMHSFC